MKKKIFLIVTLAMVLLLVGAYFLYNNLSGKMATDQLVSVPQLNNGGASGNTNQQTDTTTIESGKPTQDMKPSEGNGSAESTESAENLEPTESTEAPEETQASARPVVQAPNFTVYDAAGNPAQLHDFVGKPIVLNFWASWCGPCKNEMPEFQEVFDELGAEVTFLMVNAGGETANDVKSFLQQTGYTFPVLFDTTGRAAAAYGVTGLPTTYFINAEGTPVTHAIGTINKATLLKGISYINP